MTEIGNVILLSTTGVIPKGRAFTSGPRDLARSDTIVGF